MEYITVEMSSLLKRKKKFKPDQKCNICSGTGFELMEIMEGYSLEIWGKCTTCKNIQLVHVY